MNCILDWRRFDGAELVELDVVRMEFRKKIHWVAVGLVGAGEVIAVDSALDSNTSNVQFFEANI